MPRKIQPSYTKYPGHVIAATGDSLTYASYFPGLRADLHSINVLGQKLAALGLTPPIRLLAKNYGIGGQTTTQLAATPRLWAPIPGKVVGQPPGPIPDVVVLYGGTNDPSNGISAATTQANLTAIAQAYLNAGCNRIVIVGQHYKNYAAGALDTTSVQNAGELALRNAQSAAAASFTGANAGKVVYCDLYAFMRSIVLAGTYTANDGTVYTIGQGIDSTPGLGGMNWHVADQNAHLNKLGHDVLASAQLATIQAQAGWVAALQT